MPDQCSTVYTNSRKNIVAARLKWSWLTLSLAGSLLLAITTLGHGLGVWFFGSLVGSVATVGLLKLSLRLRQRYTRRLLRIIFSLGASWTIMIFVIVAGFCVTPDPYARERIARSGFIIYVLMDKLFRGLFFGTLVGTFMFSWAWLPMAALWHVLVKWIEAGDLLS